MLEKLMNESKTILLVEDENIARLVNSRLLRDLGYEPDIAVTGEAAVEMGNKHYDIIFMDIGLPGIDGLEATRQIRSKEVSSTKSSKIVALTAYCVDDYRDACIDAGMNGIASKPITMERLKEIIEEEN